MRAEKPSNNGGRNGVTGAMSGLAAVSAILGAIVNETYTNLKDHDRAEK